MFVITNHCWLIRTFFRRRLLYLNLADCPSAYMPHLRFYIDENRLTNCYETCEVPLGNVNKLDSHHSLSHERLKLK